MTHFVYLLLDLLTLSFPLAYSFTARSGFSRKLPRVLTAIALVAAPMLAWDAWFSASGVWGFNPRYVLGPRLFGLPFEELLFFLCIPFSCLFIYDTLTKFPRLALPEKPVRIAAGLLGLALFVLSVLNASRAYTTLCFMVAAPLLFAIAGGHLGRRAGHLATAWLIQLVPFLLVNGVLTALPVVWYNNAENLGLRLGSIPVEDFAYSMILLFGGVFVLETKAWKDPP